MSQSGEMGSRGKTNGSFSLLEISKIIHTACLMHSEGDPMNINKCSLLKSPSLSIVLIDLGNNKVIFLYVRK